MVTAVRTEAEYTVARSDVDAHVAADLLVCMYYHPMGIQKCVC